MTTSVWGAPVLILGISERSGTNFLFHLLNLHPDCFHGGPIWDNYLTLHLDRLVAFTDAVYRDWNPQWQVESTIGPSSTLRADLGSGLVRYLHRQLPSEGSSGDVADRVEMHPTATRAAVSGVRRLVAKTPSVRNLQWISEFFPESPLIILVRDGRAVVESAHRSFQIDYEDAMRTWATAARTILRELNGWSSSTGDADVGETDVSMPSHDNGSSHFAQPLSSRPMPLVVKYEDLYTNQERELRRIFGHLQLDPSRYDFQAAMNLPVIGSSEVKQKTGKLHWEGEPKRGDFAPIQRWHAWSPARRRRFCWLAGDESEQLGYAVERPKASVGVWRLKMYIADGWWHLRHLRTLARYWVDSFIGSIGRSNSR